MSKNKVHLGFLFVLFVFIMIAVDVSGQFSYWGRSALKIGMFGLIPGFLSAKQLSFKNLFAKGKYFNYILLGSSGIVVAVLAGYFILNIFGAFSSVSTSLSNQVGVTLNNYPFVFMYVILINGPLEEFYFRFIMMDVKLFPSDGIQTLFSSFLFAIYHVGMLFTMFPFHLFVLAIAGLMVVGFVFIKINQLNQGILYSTTLHMAANLGINIVGAIILFS